MKHLLKGLTNAPQHTCPSLIHDREKRACHACRCGRRSCPSIYRGMDNEYCIFLQFERVSKWIIHQRLDVGEHVFFFVSGSCGYASLVSVQSNRSSNLGSHLTNTRKRRVKTTNLQLLVRHLVGKGLSCDEHIVVGDSGRSSRQYTQACAG